MPGKHEIAQAIARELRAAIAADGFRAKRYLTESVLRTSDTAVSLREISSWLSTVRDNQGLFLSSTEQVEVLELASGYLDLSDKQLVVEAVRAARNEDFATLVDIVSEIIERS